MFVITLEEVLSLHLASTGILSQVDLHKAKLEGEGHLMCLATSVQIYDYGNLGLNGSILHSDLLATSFAVTSKSFQNTIRVLFRS